MHPSALRSGIRIASLDAWRGLAALMVVALHTTVLHGPDPQLRNNPLYHSLAFGSYGVQIFFVVSGLCVAQAAFRALDRSAPVAAFVGARVRRIYPPYAITSLVSVLLSAGGAYLVAQNILPSSSIGAERLFARPPLDFACSALLLQRLCHVRPLVPVFWTLCYEAAFYGVVAAALWAAAAFRRDCLILDLCHALTLACSAAQLVAPGTVFYPFDLWPEFGLGVLVLDILTLRRRAAFAALAATAAMQVAHAVSHLGQNTGMQAAASLAFCLVLLVTNPVDDRVARWLPARLLARVGAFSYSLYLSHWLTMGPVAQLFRKLQISPADSYWIMALAQIAAAVLISRLFYEVAERPFITGRRRRIDREATRSGAVPAFPGAM